MKFIGKAAAPAPEVNERHVVEAIAAVASRRVSLLRGHSGILAHARLSLVRDANLALVAHLVAHPSKLDEPQKGERRRFQRLSVWARLDSNQGPTDYESAALTS